ncbi:UPF0149 family protein [Lacimicrobium alkaliphilum]|uniref:YecA family protein n=1 Tax=Lacimicrobium alkaliphilum TaxID=1526571 RepID=A0ABQ1RBG8_9ALTE|nr:UPF0149 family protein [Lacimicrobium alkaliphilum]GGD61077.1 hypothetical protein GCM10011357_15460 [Lacimicrobium alkaliphilum]
MNHHKLAELCDQYPQQLRGHLEIQGLCFAVAAAPEIPPPEQWMAWTLIAPEDIDQALADKLAEPLMDCFKQQLMQMRDENTAGIMPAECEYFPAMTMESPLSQWLCGCLLGHRQLEPVWQKSWQRMQQQVPEKAPDAAKELSHILRLLSTFANIELAIEQADERGNPDLRQQLPGIAMTLPRALASYVRLSGTLAGYLPNQFETFQSGD